MLLMMRIIGAIAVCFTLLASGFTSNKKPASSGQDYDLKLVLAELDEIFSQNGILPASQFSMPIGPPNAKGYYNAQPFGKNDHLGDDWNGVGGGNTDLGDPVFNIANGWVYQARDEGPGWGNVVRVIHQLPRGSDPVYVESVYAHLDEIFVKKGETIRIGDRLGTIGNADGIYLAHLHLELRNEPKRPLGGGYGKNMSWFLDPTQFIRTRLK